MADHEEWEVERCLQSNVVFIRKPTGKQQYLVTPVSQHAALDRVEPVYLDLGPEG